MREVMIRKPARNWTSTKVPMWEGDLIEFWRAGPPFEVREVSTPEHEDVIVRFARSHNLKAQKSGTTIIIQ